MEPTRYWVNGTYIQRQPYYLEVLARYARQRIQRTPLLFVHGACLDARCFDDKLLPAFAALGYDAHAVSLRYHETHRDYMLFNPSRIRDYVEDVWQVAQQFETLPVVIGHSVGGFIVMKYLEKHPAAAAILLSTIPVYGFWSALYRTLKRYAVGHVWDFISGKRNFLRVSADQFSTYCFTDDILATMPRQQLMRYHARLHLESFFVLYDMLGGDLPQPEKAPPLPMLVLGALHDVLLSPEDTQRTAEAYHAEWDIFPHMAHDICREAGSDATVTRMHDWLQTLKLP